MKPEDLLNSSSHRFASSSLDNFSFIAALKLFSPTVS